MVIPRSIPNCARYLSLPPPSTELPGTNLLNPSEKKGLNQLSYKQQERIVCMKAATKIARTDNHWLIDLCLQTFQALMFNSSICTRHLKMLKPSSSSTWACEVESYFAFIMLHKELEIRIQIISSFTSFMQQRLLTKAFISAVMFTLAWAKSKELREKRFLNKQTNKQT